MIVVATTDFQVYHEVVNELRDRDAIFTTRRPDRPVPEGTRLVIATEGDDLGDLDPDVTVVHAAAGEPRAAVQRALSTLHGADGRTVIGIDPGERPGVAVCHGDDVVAVYHVPRREVGALVRAELDGAANPVVRIGDGARLQGAGIVDDLPAVRVELVDETGTTPSLGTGTRGMGDVLAAVNIARRPGDPIEDRSVEPTAGEIQAIKNRSRRRSGDRSISDDLARRVASGDLTLEEALAAHRER